MAEFGIIAAAGPQHVGPLIERISDLATRVPDMVRASLSMLADQLVALTKQINVLEAQMHKHCRKEPEVARLLSIPGVGPITVSAILAAFPTSKDSDQVATSRYGLAWYRVKTRAAAKNDWAPSPRWVIAPFAGSSSRVNSAALKYPAAPC
jgi:hypothetical protein